MSAIRAVVVAVPARDEELRLPAALGAVARAALRCPVPVVVVVAADTCSDRTAELAGAHGALVVECRTGLVGGARGAAVRAGLEAAGVDAGAVWIANTDADSVVPEDWLLVHLEFATAGAVLLRGSVRPDAQLDPGLARAWAARNPPRERHRHVHGANLGVRADVHRRAGGFPAVGRDEDVGLVKAVRALGHRTRSTDRAPVVTSSRLTGRADAGFAAYLRALMAQESSAGA